MSKGGKRCFFALLTTESLEQSASFFSISAAFFAVQLPRDQNDALEYYRTRRAFLNRAENFSDPKTVP